MPKNQLLATMKKIFCILCAGLAIYSCDKYDDTDIWTEIYTLQKRVSQLEETCKQINTNVNSLQVITDALQKQDYITKVVPIEKDGEQIGYAISLAYGGSFTIINGNYDLAPRISVIPQNDGLYYWTINGRLLLDRHGSPACTSGTDGITPQLKIEKGDWYISIDGGETWSFVSASTGDSPCPIIDVDTSNEDYLSFKLCDGDVIQLPRYMDVAKLLVGTWECKTQIEDSDWGYGRVELTLIFNRDGTYQETITDKKYFVGGIENSKRTGRYHYYDMGYIGIVQDTLDHEYSFTLLSISTKEMTILYKKYYFDSYGYVLTLNRRS